MYHLRVLKAAFSFSCLIESTLAEPNPLAQVLGAPIPSLAQAPGRAPDDVCMHMPTILPPQSAGSLTPASVLSSSTSPSGGAPLPIKSLLGLTTKPVISLDVIQTNPADLSVIASGGVLTLLPSVVLSAGASVPVIESFSGLAPTTIAIYPDSLSLGRSSSSSLSNPLSSPTRTISIRSLSPSLPPVIKTGQPPLSTSAAVVIQPTLPSVLSANLIPSNTVSVSAGLSVNPSLVLSASLSSSQDIFVSVSFAYSQTTSISSLTSFPISLNPPPSILNSILPTSAPSLSIALDRTLPANYTATTFATSTSSSTTSSMSAIPTSDIDYTQCPGIDGQNYTDTTRNPSQNYQIQCYRAYTGQTLYGRQLPDFKSCLEFCTEVNVGFSATVCYGATWLAFDTGIRCLLKTYAGMGNWTESQLVMSGILLTDVPLPMPWKYPS